MVIFQLGCSTDTPLDHNNKFEPNDSAGTTRYVATKYFTKMIILVSCVVKLYCSICKYAILIYFRNYSTVYFVKDNIWHLHSLTDRFF